MKIAVGTPGVCLLDCCFCCWPAKLLDTISSSSPSLHMLLKLNVFLMSPPAFVESGADAPPLCGGGIGAAAAAFAAACCNFVGLEVANDFPFLCEACVGGLPAIGNCGPWAAAVAACACACAWACCIAKAIGTMVCTMPPGIPGIIIGIAMLFPGGAAAICMPPAPTGPMGQRNICGVAPLIPGQAAKPAALIACCIDAAC
mmetsp:Transcript_65251/g.187919  ORF Transcript_65251/g.187919 Transcript_65251/m.187919 type:complete len:201 (+) Transcript_65251:309-911(+)